MNILDHEIDGTILIQWSLVMYLTLISTYKNLKKKKKNIYIYIKPRKINELGNPSFDNKLNNIFISKPKAETDFSTREKQGEREGKGNKEQ